MAGEASAQFGTDRRWLVVAQHNGLWGRSRVDALGHSGVPSEA